MSMFLKRYLTYHWITKPILGIFLFFLVFFALKSEVDNRAEELEKVVININDVYVHAWIANTNKSRKDGLSILNYLNEDEAMLFIFDEVDIHTFWMKDMQFPIDIVWLDENKKVVSIKEHALPEDFPEVYSPSEESLYVLEFKAGFTQSNNLRIGDQIHWEVSN